MKCIFCNAEIEKGTEKIHVTNRGDMYYFCSNKCQKNMLKLKRKPRKVKWTREYRKEKEARLKVLAEKKPKETKKKKTEDKIKTKKDKKKTNKEKNKKESSKKNKNTS